MGRKKVKKEQIGKNENKPCTPIVWEPVLTAKIRLCSQSAVELFGCV